jgi:hypothetical protein
MAAAVWLGLVACSGSESPPAAGGDTTEALPLLGSGGLEREASAAPESGVSSAFALFVDPDSGVRTADVRDVDRQIVHFDPQREAMVWAASGDPVGGWVADGNELRWARGGAFRVRFGTEAGERRAYFTEADRGTICDLEISAPEQLSLRPSSETPPRP